MGVRVEVQLPEVRTGSAAPCGVGSRPRGRRAAALLGTAIALAACGAYALGWIEETSLLFVVIGFVVYARAKLGWFG